MKRLILILVAYGAATASSFAAPVISTPPAPTTTVTAGGTVTLSVTATGNGTLSYQWNKETAPLTGKTGASLTIDPVHVADAGNYTVAVTDADDTITSAAGVLTVNKADQTITFDPLAPVDYGTAAFPLTASSTSDLPITYSSSDPAVATISGGNVTVLAPGMTTITAVQHGNDDFNAADSVTQDLTVNKADQTITWTLPTPKVGDGNVTLSATAPAGAVTFTGDNASVATVTSSGTVTIVHAGTVDITASQAGSANYNSATDTKTLTIAKGNQTITFGTLPSLKVGGADVTILATATNGGAVTFVSGNTTIATIVDNKVHPVKAGNVTIEAQQAGDDDYNAATGNATLTIAKGDRTVSIADPGAKTYAPDLTFTLSPTITPNATATWASSDTNIATVDSGGNVTIVDAGSVTLTATVAADANYAEATGSREITIAPQAPVITDTRSTDLRATEGQVFVFGPLQMNAHSQVVTFSMTGAPTGLSIHSDTGAISGTPTTSNDIGTYTITVKAENVTGSTTKAYRMTLVGPSPVITQQPVAQSVLSGGSATFTATATGADHYQWRKNGVAIEGATTSNLTVAHVTKADAGQYSMTAWNDSGSVNTDSVALLVDESNLPPTISKQPVAQSVRVGGGATFSVTATGENVTYQWYKDGVAIEGATDATLTIPHATAATAGQYTVKITNPNGSVTSDPVALDVSRIAYFGTFGTDGGPFALYVQPDLTGVFLGYAKDSGVVLVSRDVVVTEDGHFNVTPTAAAPTTSSVLGHKVAAQQSDYVVDGTIAEDGTVSGTVSGLDLTLAAPAPAVSGPTEAYAGFYQAGAVGTSATTYTIADADGHAFVANVTSAGVDAGEGTISADGEIAVTTSSGAAASGTIDDSSTLTVAVTPAAGGDATTFVGANNQTRAEDEKLINISTRAQIGTGENVLIAGFVVTGPAPKTVLIRGVGPTMSSFDIANPLSAAKLQLFQGSTVLKTSTDWSSSANADQIAAAGTRVGAFDLPVGSHDAALLVTLDPGSYTAVVSGTDGATGVGMVEVYDATEGAIPNAQRLVNISSRGIAGSSENVLTAGFSINGTVPKRVLIRGVGPSLSQYSIGGYVEEPSVKLLSGSTEVAHATGIAAADATEITEESARVGAFPLLPGSKDSAMIVYLMPGLYTVQLSNAAGTNGVAMLEVYELP